MTKGNVDIVLVRMDKIGDLVVTLPVDEHPALAGLNVHWLITQGLGFVTEQSVPKRQATEFKRRFSPLEFFRMVRWFKRQAPQIVIHLHNPWWVSLAAWWADVPIRIGRRSQWHSLFYNLTVKQKRSRSDRHESDFNFDLVEWAFVRLGVRATDNLSQRKQTHLHLMAPNPFGTLASRQLKEQGYRVVHPGMGGSALNWPKENFVALIESLAKEMPVLVTGTKADAKFLRGLESAKSIKNVYWMVDALKIYELLDILALARSVVAPSTGVLHLAAALGTPAIGIYSPRRVEHPRRWGPKGRYVTALTPPVSDGDDFRPEVMSQIGVADVVQAVHSLERSHGARS